MRRITQILFKKKTYFNDQTFLEIPISRHIEIKRVTITLIVILGEHVRVTFLQQHPQ